MFFVHDQSCFTMPPALGIADLATLNETTPNSRDEAKVCSPSLHLPCCSARKCAQSNLCLNSEDQPTINCISSVISLSVRPVSSASSLVPTSMSLSGASSILAAPGFWHLQYQAKAGPLREARAVNRRHPAKEYLQPSRGGDPPGQAGLPFVPAPRASAPL